MQHIYSVGDIAAAVRGRRLDLKLSQRELAKRAVRLAATHLASDPQVKLRDGS